ncbi:EF-hand domain-containing protein [Sphingomonas sp.]|uniref:EF-hand domain-containing protein n=1 Tax=Sphingomonas sp. TaxID=28214 RepID=UPI0035A8CFE8
MTGEAAQLGYANAPKGGYRSRAMAIVSPPPKRLVMALLLAGSAVAGLTGLTGLAVLPAMAQRAPGAGDPAGAARTPPITQPPSATIMAEPVALFIGATDADDDARVTRAEMRAGVTRSFASVDKARPESLGYIELADWAERWLGDRNALPSAYETDTDGDNRITLAELIAQIDKTFTRFDRNKDDVLVRSELLTLDSARGNGLDQRGQRRRQPQ